MTEDTPTQCINVGTTCRSREGAPVYKRGRCNACYRRENKAGTLAPKPPSVTLEHGKAVAILIAQGATMTAAAVEAGVDPQKLLYHMKKNPELKQLIEDTVRNRPGRGYNWTAERQEALLADVRSGKSLYEIAEKLGFERSSLSHQIHADPEFLRKYEEARESVPRTATTPPALYYYDRDHRRQKITALLHFKLKLIAAGPVTVRDRPEWRDDHVRALEDRGLATITWSRPNQAGDWTIRALTDLGNKTLADSSRLFDKEN